MANPNTDQFDIEDIIREFGSSAPEEETLEEQEELTQEEPAEEPVQAELSLEEEPEEPMEDEYEMDFSLPQDTSASRHIPHCPGLRAALAA